MKIATTIEFHDAANIFPLDDENIESLAGDIKAHGQLCPIELLDGKILDGRRRWMACRQAGVEPEFVTVSPEDPISYVISLNRHRRHLTPSQMSMVAARARAMYDKEADARMKSGKKSDPMENLPQGAARDAAGKAVGVSGKSVDFASKVLKNAEPEIIKAVDEGRMAVSTAAIYATEPAEVQRKVAADPKRNRSYVGQSAKAAHEKKEAVEPEAEPGKSRGVGVRHANEAVDCLKRIPKNDALRKRGFQIVTDWIKQNR